MEVRYTRYKEWITSQGLDNHGYVLRFVEWDASECAALEPNLVPYELEEGTSHWVLWHHPDTTAGDAELDPAAERRLAARLLGVADLRADEAIVFQNVPIFRSIPTIAHSHAFLRPCAGDGGAALRQALEARREAWTARSPWLTGDPQAGASFGTPG